MKPKPNVKRKVAVIKKFEISNKCDCILSCNNLVKEITYCTVHAEIPIDTAKKNDWHYYKTKYKCALCGMIKILSTYSNYKLKEGELLLKKDGEIVCLDCYKLEIKSHI